MARRWDYYLATIQPLGEILVHRVKVSEKPCKENASEAAALRTLSERIEGDVRRKLNQLDAIRVGKVTRTWVKRK